MTGWTLRQLTFGTEEGRFHAHSYYDIPVFDAAGRRIVGVETSFAERPPTPSDTVGVGIVEADRPGSWREIGRSSAWSWQQGPMAQWVPGRDAVIWNDRAAPEADTFVARIADPDGRELAALPRGLRAGPGRGVRALARHGPASTRCARATATPCTDAPTWSPRPRTTASGGCRWTGARRS